MIPVFEIIFVAGIILAAIGIACFLLKERNYSPVNHVKKAIIQKAEYGKILSSACVTIGVWIWFFSVPYSELNILVLIACTFTFPGDFILSRDLTKLLIAIPLFAVAYILMSLRGIAEVASAPVNPLAFWSCVVISILAIGAVLIVYGRKLTPPPFRIAASIYSLIDLVFLYTGLALIFQVLAVVPGIGMISLVIGDVIAVVNIVKPFKNKPVYDFVGGVLYFVGLYAVVLYFTL